MNALSVILAAIALATAYAEIPSHDNILRIQLWDAEGLSRDPITTLAPSTTTKRLKLKVNSELLFHAMLEEAHEGSFGRFTRHKVRHKRRRPRQSGTDLPWRFHSGANLVNVALYDNDEFLDLLGNGSGQSVKASAVSDSSASSDVNEERAVGPPMTLRQPEEEVMSEGKHYSNVPFFNVIVAPRWLIAIHELIACRRCRKDFYSGRLFMTPPRAMVR